MRFSRYDLFSQANECLGKVLNSSLKVIKSLRGEAELTSAPDHLKSESSITGTLGGETTYGAFECVCRTFHDLAFTPFDRLPDHQELPRIVVKE